MGGIEVGATCHLGKGRTVWEIVGIRAANWLELSALGRGGFVNRTAQAHEVNSVTAQRIDVPLAAVLSERARAQAAAKELYDRLRFSHPDDIQTLAQKAHDTAVSYAAACAIHATELATIGIEDQT